MRVKVQNKKQFAYDGTLLGLKKVLKMIEENKIPDDACIYFRGRVVEVMWSSLNDSSV